MNVAVKTLRLDCRPIESALPRPKTGECETCGEWANPLADGMCAPCRSLLRPVVAGGLPAAPVAGPASDLEDIGAVEALIDLQTAVGERTRGLVDISATELGFLLDAALREIAGRIRRNERVGVPHLGVFARYEDRVGFVPAPELTRRVAS